LKSYVDTENTSIIAYVDNQDDKVLSEASIYTDGKIQEVNNTIHDLDEKVEDYNRNTNKLLDDVSEGIIRDYTTAINNLNQDVSRNDTWLYNHIEKYNTNLSTAITTNDSDTKKLIKDVSDLLD